jgi:hypothetical protein
MEWSAIARRVIAEVDAANATLPPAERLKVIDAAYPFGERDCWPYKAWLKARKEWIGKHVRMPVPVKHETPMERMMRLSKEAEAVRELQGSAQ